MNTISEARFVELMKETDTPEGRIKDWGWLTRNFGIRNSSNPNYDVLMAYIKQRAKEERR